MECRSSVLSASQIVGSAPEGSFSSSTDSLKEGPVQTHKGFLGNTITTGNEVKPTLEKKKGSLIVNWYS